MLRADLLDAINSGDAWAFVGSGVSADAGAPPWGDLVSSVVSELNLNTDSAFRFRAEKRDWPACFQQLEDLAGRDRLESAVRRVLLVNNSGKPLRPGRLHRTLADMPFAGYITTNYDTLLEDSLSSDPGWLSVGNVGNEVRKVAGGATRLIWHVHGALGTDTDLSRLILTSADYDDLYAEDAPVVRQMRALLATRRLIFVGFGLEDADIMQVLRVLGRLANPALPIFAIVPHLGRFAHADERRQLLHRFKVDVLTYPVTGESHAACLELLDLYASLAIRRSLKFGRELPPPRDYDPETTGLLIYNELVLREHLTVPGDLKESLVVAWVLTRLAGGPCDRTVLQDSFVEIQSVLAGEVGLTTSEDSVLGAAIIYGTQQGWIAVSGTTVGLTTEGEAAVKDRQARASVQSERFNAALLARAREMLTDPKAAQRVAVVARSYFDDCIERRALGVARAASTGRFNEQEYHAVALLQGLRNFLGRVENTAESRALVALVTGVLSEQKPDEVDYIGTAVQARFGLHLLGYDADTLRVRGEDFQHTAFVVDSNTLIPLLARSSVANAEAVELVSRLRGMAAPLLTTKLLSDEVIEHAQYAKDTVGTSRLELSVSALEAATGRSDVRSNAFLEGLTSEVAGGRTVPEVDLYLADVLGIQSIPLRRIASHSKEVDGRLEALGITRVRLEALEGFTDSIGPTIRGMADRLAVRRGATYRHDRQVRAEAEAAVMVLGIRRGSLHLPGEPQYRNAYFISNTRVIDDEAGERVTMSRDNALHWLATLRPYSPAHAAAIYGGLLWELQERNADLVGYDTLRRVFRPLLVASRDQLDEELHRHRDLIETQYGGEGADAMAKVAAEATPTVLSTYQAEQNVRLEDELAAARAQIAKLEDDLGRAQQAAERNEKKLRGKARYDKRTKRGR